MGKESVVIYFSIIVLLVYLAKRASLVTIKKRQTNNKEPFFTAPTFLLISIFTIFCAIRYNVGTDYPRYLSAYETGRAFTERYEPLYRALSYLLYKFNANVAVFFGLWALLQIVLYLYAFKNQKKLYPYLVYFLFTNGLFLSWMNGIRQDLSSCMVLPALIFIVERRPKPYMITCVLASLFHVSALILLILYPLLGYRQWFKNNTIPIILVVIALATNYSLANNIRQLDAAIGAYAILFDRDAVDYYMLMESMEEKSGMGLGMLVRLLFYISIILYSRELKSFYKNSFFEQIIYPLFILGVFFKYAIPVGAVIISRPFRFFSFFTTIALVYFVYYLMNSKSNMGKLYGVAIIVISLVLFLAPMINASPDDSFILYQTIFDNL